MFAIIADQSNIYREAPWQTAENGQSIAEVTATVGVDPRGVIDALLAVMQANIDAEMADGHITPDEVAALLVELSGMEEDAV